MVNCPICLSKLGQYHQLKCSHKFHHQCIKILFAVYNDPYCPICRRVYIYKPANKRKPMKKLRQLIINRHNNDGCIDIEVLKGLVHYFRNFNIHIEFLEMTCHIYDSMISKGDQDYKQVSYFDNKTILFIHKSNHGAFIAHKKTNGGYHIDFANIEFL